MKEKMTKRIENMQLIQGNYYFIKFLDHNLRTKYAGDVTEETYSFVGQYMDETENMYIFYLLNCSIEESSDIFQVVKGTIIDFCEMIQNRSE